MAGIRNYDYAFPPPRFPRPHARPSKGKFLQWSVTGVNTNAWLRQHNHGWEFRERYLDMIIKEVQELAFKQYGPHAGRTQLDYLTEDLKMDASHLVSSMLTLSLEWISLKPT